MNDLKSFALSRVGKPARGPQGQVTAALPVGTLRVPLSLYEQVKEAVRTIDPWHSPENRRSYQNKGGYIALLRRGLDKHNLSGPAIALVNSSRAIRRLLEGVEELQLDPLPCPRDVDPRWWQEQETERLLVALQEVRRVVRETSKLSNAAAEAEKQIGVLSREGA